jgi:hypothetical protein
MTKDEEAALTMRAETAEMLLEAEREEVERLRAELAQAQAQLEGKEPPKKEIKPSEMTKWEVHYGDTMVMAMDLLRDTMPSPKEFMGEEFMVEKVSDFSPEQLDAMMSTLRDMYPLRYPQRTPQGQGKLFAKVNKNPYKDSIEVVLSLDIPGAPRNHCAFSLPRYRAYTHPEDVKWMVIEALGNMPEIRLASIPESDINDAVKYIARIARELGRI